MTLALADLLRARLDPLTARLRRPAIAALARRLRGSSLPEVLAGLPGCLAELRREHAELAARHAGLVLEVEAAATPAARRAVLARALRRDVPDPRRRRGDLRSLRRWLDLDVLGERVTGELDALEVQVELALQVAAAALADPAVARGPVGALGTCLLGQLTWLRRFTLRLACLDALTRLVRARRAERDADAIALAARARLDDPREHPWVQAAAAGLLAQLAPDDALAAARDRLLRPRPGRRDFLARRLLVDGLAGRLWRPRDPEDMSSGTWRDSPVPARAVRDLLLDLAAAGDPSEHVRIGLVRALAALAPADPRAAGLLRAALDPAREASPRVRAHAVRAAARMPPTGAALALVACLEGDPAELVLRVACAELGPLAAQLVDACASEHVHQDMSRSTLAAPPLLVASARHSGPLAAAVTDPAAADAPDLRTRLSGPLAAAVTDPAAADDLDLRAAALGPPAPVDPSARLALDTADAPGAIRPDMSARIGPRPLADVSARLDRAAGLTLDPADAPADVRPDTSARILAASEPALLDMLHGTSSEATAPDRLTEAPSSASSGALGREGIDIELDDDAPDARAALAALAAALARLAARDDRSPAAQEAAAAALEALDRAVDPRRRAWSAAIASVLAATPPGRRARIDLRRPDLPPAGDELWLGRILADLARDDWGLDADVRGDSLLVRRGDRFRPRLWRILHELRHPGPGKRQAHPHTRGRSLSGRLRAHSARLHEVTATGVPGERVHCEREGGWGRHLPLVDDLLGLPLLRARPVRVVSSHGVTELRWRVGPLGRLLARARLTLGYAWYAEQRRQALAADEPGARGRYARAVRERLGVELDFRPHPPPRLDLGDMSRASSPGPPTESDPLRAAPRGREVPAQLAALFAAHGPAAAPPAAAALALPALLLAPDLLEWLSLHGGYFLGLAGNNQQALVYFLAAAFGLFLLAAYLRRGAIARDRAAIPLVVGGWGTRGKSGTERLKAGLFHGLGYRVFAKTTGCEAIFIHAAPQSPALEIYTFRPYGKATIWEQRTLLGLAARLHSDVFLWECMALSPAYVDVLQHHWMRDDLSTITNCYPDHEDIQGPAGIDVAEVIARFVPTRAEAITSELNFAPVLREAARARRSALLELDPFAGDLLPADLLALFPYDEHPRNVALVARMAAHLGLDPDLALVTMAEHVVPDLGVLKRYGPARLRGRTLAFINGCSANERTGFLSNWRRTGCDAFDLAARPADYLVTVVNNRDDRVARSQVFARVLVEDTAVDRHLIIGTNTRGLLGFIDDALADFLAAQEIAGPDDLAEGPAGLARAERRLARLLARLRLLPPDPAALAGQLELFAAGAGLRLAHARPELLARLAPLLAPDPAAAVLLPEVRAEVEVALGTWLEDQLSRAPGHVPTDSDEPPELLAPAEPADVAAHFLRQLARAAIGARLHARLRAGFSAAALPAFHAALRAAYAALFRELLDVVEDPHATGDQVVLRCALAAPPGVRVTLMGTQNIKGTGLDFVYRWIALDAAQQALARLDEDDPALRAEALQRLARPHDPGLLDAGLVAAALRRRPPAPEHAEAHARALAGALQTHAARAGALARGAARPRWDGLWTWLETWVDFLDGARRFFVARRVMRDLVDRRISHARAAHEMRALDARAKGGWLARALRR